MRPTPVVEKRVLGALIKRELSARMRTRSTPAVISLFLVLISGVAFMIYLIGVASGAQRVGSTGPYSSVLFYFLVMMQIIAASFITPAFAAGAIAGERQRGTLALLKATLLTARDIVLGKFGVALMYGLLFIFLSLPLFSFAFMLGSIETVELFMALSIVTASAILFVSFSIYASSVGRTSAVSTAISYAFTLGMVIGLPLLLGVAIVVAQRALGGAVRFGGGTLLSDGIEAILGIMVSLSPVTSIIASRAYYETTGDPFNFRQPYLSATTGVTLPAPYITLTVVYLLLSVLFVALAVRRANRQDA